MDEKKKKKKTVQLLQKGNSVEMHAEKGCALHENKPGKKKKQQTQDGIHTDRANCMTTLKLEIQVIGFGAWCICVESSLCAA